MTESKGNFEAVAERMRTEGLPPLVIDIFGDYYQQLVSGSTGMITEEEIQPVASVPDQESLPEQMSAVGKRALKHTVVIKLNGGLGTSMGLEQAKSLLPVKEGYSFLDIIARQAIKMNVPLLLMNSFSTDSESVVALERYEELGGDIPLRFLQHKVPKIARSDFSQVVWQEDPELEWCPPGHGDIYAALITQGTLDTLLEAGYKYAFVSNADNLGATLDGKLLGYFAHNEFPFMMEVADRTAMDRKGGHLAQRATDGQFILRELAQCPEDDIDAFQNIRRHRYFNTNNVWINLEVLKRIMVERGNRLALPMIRNRKTVDPRDSTSTPVYQLETAMGSAIGVIDGSQAIRVPRSRFAPVKKTDDLLVVRSDAYVLTEGFEVVQNPRRAMEPPVVELDPEHYAFVTDLDSRFPEGPPSLLFCEKLIIEGDFLFEAGVQCRGCVMLRNDAEEQVVVSAGTILSG